MTPRTKCSLHELKVGARFYKCSDTSKTVWQVIDIKGKYLCKKGNERHPSEFAINTYSNIGSIIKRHHTSVMPSVRQAQYELSKGNTEYIKDYNSLITSYYPPAIAKMIIE